MRFYTRGNTDPNGKQRVFFVSHPEDAAEYERSYAQLLLERRDCAVYACEDAAHPDADWQEQVRGMQMVVIPVTRRFLEEPAFAGAVLVFAIQKNIPLLLIQEVGVQSKEEWERFNHVCRKRQALKHGETGEGESLFDRKLDEFIESVLIDDSLAEEVREGAFDGHIFLSYRKKDIRYLEELARTIHDLPGCESLSLWYDNYLEIGINYEDTIEENLRRSGLVLMVVTPRIAEPGNYVIKEYGMARGYHKEILPIEMERTNPEEIAPRFPGIREFYTLNQAEAIRDRLMTAKETPKAAGGEQMYLLGIAFLKGIRVEKDPGRGIGLLRTALNQYKYRPAGRLLISLYRRGIDVARDLRAAREISMQVAASYGPWPQQLSTELYYEFLEDSYADCTLAMEEGKEDFAVNRLLFLRQEAMLLKEKEGRNTDELLLRVLQSYREACERYGRYEDADRFLEEEARILERCGGTHEEQMIETGRMLLRKAEHSLYQAKPAEGQASCEEVLRIASQMEEGKDVVFLRAEAWIMSLELEYYRLGTVEKYWDQLEAMQRDFHRVAEIYREEAEPHALLRRLYRLAARQAQRDGNTADAMDFYDQAVSSAEKYARRNPEIGSGLMLFDARLDRLQAALLTGSGDALQSLMLLAKLYEDMNRLHQDAYNRPEFKSVLAKYHLVTEAAHLRMGNRPMAEQQAMQAVRLSEDADTLRHHPEDLLTSVFAMEWIMEESTEQLILDEILRKMDALCRDFPENDLYRQMRQNYQMRHLLALEHNPRGERMQEDLPALIQQYQDFLRLPSGIERLLQLDQLCSFLAEMKRKYPEQPGYGQLLTEAGGAVNREIRTLYRRVQELANFGSADAAQREADLREAVRILEALLQVLPNDEDFQQMRRMLLGWLRM